MRAEGKCVSLSVCFSSGYNIFQIPSASNQKDNSLDFLTCGMAGGDPNKLFDQIFARMYPGSHLNDWYLFLCRKYRSCILHRQHHLTRLLLLLLHVFLIVINKLERQKEKH